MNDSNKRSFLPPDNSSSMETEPPETNQNNRPNNSLFAELQFKRENRRASDRPEPPQNFNYGAPDEHPINLHDDLDHHHQNTNDEDNEQNHHHESMIEGQNTGENSVGSLAPVRSFGSGILSYLQNWGNSFRRSPRESQQQQQPQLPGPEPLPHPFPMYQSPVPHLLPDVLDEQDDIPHHHHHHPLPQITDEPQQEDPEEFSGNTFNLFPHGALIVRTVSPGPDGAVLVRMRVIPMDGIFGDHGEEDGPSPVALFGALVRMLAGGSFLERGLDKEALDSLPVVKYETEAFKNVDSESKRCTICFDDYEDGHELRYLWCLHRFHKGCVDHWLQNHTNCPVCKKDYFEAQKETFVD